MQGTMQSPRRKNSRLQRSGHEQMARQRKLLSVLQVLQLSLGSLVTQMVRRY